MTNYHCKVCGWRGKVNSRPRCLRCAARKTREWRKANPEAYRRQKARYDKRFRLERPDEYRAKRRRYYLPQTAKRARLRRIEWLKAGTVTRKELQAIYAFHKGCCAYCGKHVPKPRYSPIDPRGFDHVISRALGGKHEKENIVVCCRSCNELKR